MVGNELIDFIYFRIGDLFHQIIKQVTLVEWLTRGPANKLGRAFGRVGSNPAGDVIFVLFALFVVFYKF